MHWLNTAVRRGYGSRCAAAGSGFKAFKASKVRFRKSAVKRAFQAKQHFPGFHYTEKSTACQGCHFSKLKPKQSNLSQIDGKISIKRAKGLFLAGKIQLFQAQASPRRRPSLRRAKESRPAAASRPAVTDVQLLPGPPALPPPSGPFARRRRRKAGTPIRRTIKPIRPATPIPGEFLGMY